VAEILIVDDDDDVRRVLARMLTRAGYRARTAADGAAAMGILAEARPDLVITDVYMPEMDGIEFLLRIREVEPELPIIVVSGGGFASADFVLEDASALGADAILSKPFERSVVLDTVRRILEPAA
jgi:CheY-like chemotaxis protein